MTDHPTRSLMLRRLPADLVGRLRAYARSRSLPLPEAAARLLTMALDTSEDRRHASAVLHASRTPEERSAAARHAITERWRRVRERQP